MRKQGINKAEFDLALSAQSTGPEHLLSKLSAYLDKNYKKGDGQFVFTTEELNTALSSFLVSYFKKYRISAK